MSDEPTEPSPLAPEVSPLAEADPNSVNVLIQERIDEIFNTPPALLTDDKLRIAVEWYRKERVRFLIESQNKPARAAPKKKVPTSVSDALESSSDFALMQTFRMRADVVFDAENIIDAFEKLATHFIALTTGDDSTLFKANSQITIEPKED